jgi:paraquat-inducible protein B
MSDAGSPGAAAAALPEAKVRRRRRLARLAWIVPIVAAVVAAYVVVERWREFGPEITIRFADGGGLRVGVTPIKYRGVRIGEVSGVELTRDLKQVLVRARLERSAGSIAREGATFWIVRPQVGLNSITGLGTVLTGPEIQALPGEGKEERSFVGLESAPVAFEEEGLSLILRTERPKALRQHSPVYYRGVEVGVVQDIALAPDATATDVRLLIRKRYAPLVQSGSMFWNVGGVRMKASLFHGIDIDLESLQALAQGGIEFATPTAKGPPVKPGTVFALHDEPLAIWLSWTPKIPLPGEGAPPVSAAQPQTRRAKSG